jgi:hypothetical protein
VRRLLFLGIAAFFACGDDAPARTPGSCPDVELLVVASAYKGSALACGAPGCVEERGRTTGRALGGDPALVRSNGRAFFLARDEDTMFTIDPSCGVPGEMIDLRSLRRPDKDGVLRNANAHDLAVADDGSMLVALHNTPGLAFLDANGAIGSVLDLAKHDAVDGNPNAESVRIINGKAFVALEVRDDGADVLKGEPVSTRPSKMLRVDVATRTEEAVIELAGRNPFNAMSQLGSALYLAEPNNTDEGGEPFGGIERFDTATMSTQLLVRESDLGASVMEVAVTEGCGAAIVAGPSPKVNPTALVTFDPNTGAVLTTFTNPAFGPTPGFDLQALLWKKGKLYVGDRRRASNGTYQVHEFSVNGACVLTPTGRNFDIGQPPVGLQAANLE